ncbi:Serpentine receptor class r-10 [Caenorhabditis elegans]|uniref:Serpentine receptor class r-10 n=1 Tax=Caenorhabditis elegans TaxID=6239 RepID=Q965K9_CAEEL|nr:Seven TM Receptor [Caenorhabditis elegans]CCD74370.2 Seven TM Receptor [Caenorhabditis elegans]|eukprot:NP_503493.2 Seven TM Receptor [Caenorhabditis elegans]
MGTYSLIKSIFQTSSCLFSLLTNCVIIVLIFSSSPSKMGSYKYLLCYFSMLSSFVAFLDLLISPYVYSFGSCAVTIMDLRDTIFEKHSNVAFCLLVFICGSFGASLFAIAINFIYRYFALERKGRLQYFKGKRLVHWISLSLLAGIIESLLFLFLGPQRELSDYVRANLREFYDLDVDKTVYVGWWYWKMENGNVNLSVDYLLKFLIMNISMIIPFFTIVYYGTKSYFKIKTVLSQGESEYSRRLQSQLYKVLVAQTFIPVVFLFIPTGFFLICPLFGLNIQWSNKPIISMYSLYIALDSIPVIFLVDEYRNAFYNFFRRLFLKNEVASVSAFDSNLAIS